MLDASAVLALLQGEPGADVVADAIADGAAISTINLIEVATTLVGRGHDLDRVLAPVQAQLRVEPFTTDDALAAARLYPKTTWAWPTPTAGASHSPEG